MTDPQLMTLLSFNESELHANRNGHISDRQQALLKKREGVTKGFAVILGLILLAVASIGLVGIFNWAISFVRPADPAQNLLRGAAIGIIWSLLWGGMGLLQVRRAFAKMQVKVAKAEGPINIVRATRRSYNPSTKRHTEHTVHELHVGQRTFEVDSQLADIMVQGNVYAVYYADFNIDDKDPEVLSAEWLGKTDRNS